MKKYSEILAEEWEEANYTNSEEVKVRIQFAQLEVLERVEGLLKERGEDAHTDENGVVWRAKFERILTADKKKKEDEELAEEWTLFVDEHLPEGRILLCGDCKEPAEIVAYCNGVRLVLDLENGTCEVSTKKYITWRFRKEG